MRKNIGIALLLFSIAATSIGSVLKLTKQIQASEVFLWIGMIMFVIAIAMILIKVFRPIRH